MTAWTLTGYALLTFGLAVVVFAWFGDQSRGRRRCRKCWYDMAAVGGRQSPECGKVHRYESGLWRTRRRPSLAATGLLTMTVAIASWHGPAYLAGGWPAVTPTWVLVWSFDDFDTWDPAWDNELIKRLRSRRVTASQHSALIKRFAVRWKQWPDPTDYLANANRVYRDYFEWLDPQRAATAYGDATSKRILDILEDDWFREIPEIPETPTEILPYNLVPTSRRAS